MESVPSQCRIQDSEGFVEQILKIPDWVRKNAKQWSLTQISDEGFVKGIQWMINNGFIKI